MSEFQIAAVAFACVLGSAMLGLFMRGALPEHHLSPESRDVVKLGTGLIATMAALVLSLLISSAKGAFDKMDDELVQNAARVISLDRTLADYGAETKEVRGLLKRIYAAGIERLFPGNTVREAKVDSPSAVIRTENFRAALLALSPSNDAQRWLLPQALDIASEISSTRWLLLMQKDVSMPTPLLVVLVCWLSLIFSTFGLLAPRNGTVIAALLICALSTAGAIFLIEEMNSPFAGMLKISSAPMRDALSDLGQ